MDRPIELTALDEEYKAQVQLLFSKLVDNLVMGMGQEEVALRHFGVGMALVRRAREIALKQINEGTNA